MVVRSFLVRLVGVRMTVRDLLMMLAGSFSMVCMRMAYGIKVYKKARAADRAFIDRLTANYQKALHDDLIKRGIAFEVFRKPDDDL